MTSCTSPRFIPALVIFTLAATAAWADPVDLGTWTAESYPAVSGFSPGSWTVSAGGSTVTQSVNGQPTLFYSDFNVFYSDVQGRIRVNTSSDNDFIGFALGFRPGDTTNGAADYLLVDWKQGDQYFDFGSPSTTPGSTALKGLAVSRVTGVPTADEFWGHTNFTSHTAGGLQQLARGTTRGSTNWADYTTYEFRFVITPTNLKVYVDSVLELDITGSFSDGRLAFYNFSQGNVTYSAFTRTQLPQPDPPGGPAPLPEPASLTLLAGISGVGLLLRSRRRKTG